MKKLSTLLLLGALLVAGTAGNALAWSAAACTDITNRATLTFFVGGVDQGDLESSPLGNSTLGVGNGADTLVRVDSRVDLDVSLLSAQPLNATGLNQVMTFQITNLGNDTQRYGLQLFSGATPADDDFNMANVRVYIDANNNGTFESGTDTLVATDVGGAGPAFGATLGTLTSDVLGAVGANDNTVAIFVVSNVPPGQPGSDTSAYALRAISYQTVAAGGLISITGGLYPAGTIQDNSCGNPVVIGDAVETNLAVGGVTDSAGDGAAFASGEYTVVAAGVSVQKTQTVIWDPINNGVGTQQAIPGAYVRYEIIISNALLAAPATLTQITDLLVAQLAFDADLATAGPTTFENALGNGFKVTHVSGRALVTPLYYTTTNGDADGASINAGTITAIFSNLLPAQVGPPVYAAGELLAGESVTLTFNAIIQ